MNKYLFLSLSLICFGSIVCAEKDVIEQVCKIIKLYGLYPPTFSAKECKNVSKSFALLFDGVGGVPLDEQGSVFVSRPITLYRKIDDENRSIEALHAIIAMGENKNVEEVHLFASGRRVSEHECLEYVTIFKTTYTDRRVEHYAQKHQAILSAGLKKLKESYPKACMSLEAGRTETDRFFKKAGIETINFTGLKVIASESIADPAVIQSALNQ